MYVCECSRWQTVISIIVSRVVISPVNQCHCIGPNSSKFNISRQMAQYLSSFYGLTRCRRKVIKKMEDNKIRCSLFSMVMLGFFLLRHVSSLIEKFSFERCVVSFYQSMTGTFDFLSMRYNTSVIPFFVPLKDICHKKKLCRRSICGQRNGR